MYRLALIATLSLVSVAWTQERPKAAGKAYLGVTLDDVTPQSRFKHKISNDVAAGAVLLAVLEKTPAAGAGFQPGDVVVEFDGKTIGGRKQLIEIVQDKRAGTTVGYRIRRGTGVISGKIRLGGRTPPEPRKIRRAPPVEPKMPKAAEPRPAMPDRPDNLEKRLDNVQGEIELLRKQLLEARKRSAPLRHPRSLGGWIHQEEQAAQRALAAGNETRAKYHAVRVSVLKEMQEAEFRLPARRLDRIEKRLDEILARLARLEK